MSYYLRFLKNTKYSEWLEVASKWKAESVTQDIPAKVLADWADNSPSIWQVDENKNNLDDILIAFVNKQRERNLECKYYDYLLFKDKVVKSISLSPQKTPGDTSIDLLDEEHHYEISSMTGRKVLKLIEALFNSLSKQNEDVIAARKDKKDLNNLLCKRLSLSVTSKPI